jgi:NADPH:quinone reductase-like Zn-dependent oxidoreductase
MPDTIRALVAQRVGEPADVLRLESRPRPEPGEGEVLVRVRAAPIHATDLHIMRGRYGYTPEFPTVLGSESVGVVEAVGAGVNDVEVGQRVITVLVTGTWQELIVVAASQILPVPDSVSDSTACQLVTNPLTALLLLREVGVQPGDWLLQTAAGSTVGKLVVQLAHHRGIRTINVVRRRAAVDEIRQLGGTEVICTEDEDLATRSTRSPAPKECQEHWTASPANSAPTCSKRWHQRASSSSTAPCPPTARPTLRR